MSEKRKPTYTLLLKKEGNTKSDKLELFDKFLYPEFKNRGGVWRLRVNGKWFPANAKEPRFFTGTEVRNMFFRQIMLW